MKKDWRQGGDTEGANDVEQDHLENGEDPVDNVDQEEEKETLNVLLARA